MTNRKQKYLSQKGLAERWGVARTTIYRWRKEGRPLPKASNLGPNQRDRYAMEDVIAFEREIKRPGKPDNS